MSKKFETYTEEFFSTHERMLIALCEEDGITVRELINRSKISSSAYRSPLDFLIKSRFSQNREKRREEDDS